MNLMDDPAYAHDREQWELARRLDQYFDDPEEEWED